jgi:hypothetical protein
MTATTEDRSINASNNFDTCDGINDEEGGDEDSVDDNDDEDVEPLYDTINNMLLKIDNKM